MSEQPGSAVPTPANKTSPLHLLGLTLLVLLAFGGGFLSAVARQPSKFSVQRSIVIAATPEQVFGHVNDLHKWEAWSPWAKKDPHAQNSYEGPEAGKGSVFKWSGNDDVGAGQMTITDSQSGDWVLIKLDFTRPMEDTCDVDFTFRPEGDQTKVIWTMSGQQTNFLGKVVCLIMDMDKMVGGDFEQGLASLKATVEQSTTTAE